MGAGNVAIMHDVVHAGSEYACDSCDNIRYHIYKDVAGVHEAEKEEYVRWVQR